MQKEGKRRTHEAAVRAGNDAAVVRSELSVAVLGLRVGRYGFGVHGAIADAESALPAAPWLRTAH